MIIGKRFLRRSAALLTGLLLACILTACGEGDENNVIAGNNTPSPTPLTVKTGKGKVAGIEKQSMREFLGIPYAAPPTGDLRWKPPQPAQAWTGTLSAKKFANHCPQPGGPFGLASTTEDCLYLNVFAPKDNDTHPVMVWIHGGALTSGESDDYNPVHLVNQGVVVVTINYRLGLLGFLAVPALTKEAPADRDSGNYGIEDQQAALRWVQRNISQFGGDPDNVTIFGESAGGLSVLSQLVSPTAEGLFQKAIVESGSYSTEQPTLSEGETMGTDFAKKAGCPDASAACLRNLSVKQILDNQGISISGFLPKSNTAVLPRSILPALQAGDFKKIPVMEGTNRNEWRLFNALLHAGKALTAQEYKNNNSQAVRDVYPLSDYQSPDLAAAAMNTDAIFACPGRRDVQALSKQVKTYAYEFNDPNAPELFLDPASIDYPPKGNYPFASSHASEIQYLFNFFNGQKLLANPSTLNTKQMKLSKKMVRYWTQFAKTGNPNPSSGDITFWPEYNSGSHTYLSLTPPSPKTLKTFGSEHHCSFVDPQGG